MKTTIKILKHTSKIQHTAAPQDKTGPSADITDNVFHELEV